MKLLEKLKKLNWFRISQILSLILVLNLIFASLIPNIYRWILIAIIGILDLLVFLWVSKSKSRKKINLIHVWIKLGLIILILFPNTLFAGFVRAISTKNVTHEVHFVSLNETKLSSINELKDQKIGILSDEQSLVGHIYPKQINEENALNITFVEYNSYIEAIQALQNEKIEIIVLPGGFQETFGSIENFEIDTSVLHSIWHVKFKEKVDLFSSVGDVLNIVLIGGDNPIQGNSTSGFNYDVIIVVSYNFKTQESAMISIPRDAYIFSTCTNKRDKITHTGWYGADCLTATLSKFLDIPINHYMLIDFEGLIDVVDALGGVEIDIPRRIEEQDENRSFDDLIVLEPGLQKLNGREALAFLRHRKTLTNGPLGRSNNHETFMLAMIQELAKPTKWWRIGGFLNTVQKSVLTNLNGQSIVDLYNQATMILNAEGIEALLPERMELDGQGAMIYTPSFGANLYYYVLDSQSVNTIKTRLKEINLND